MTQHCQYFKASSYLSCNALVDKIHNSCQCMFYFIFSFFFQEIYNARALVRTLSHDLCSDQDGRNLWFYDLTRKLFCQAENKGFGLQILSCDSVYFGNFLFSVRQQLCNSFIILRLYDKPMSKLPESDRLILCKSEASNTWYIWLIMTALMLCLTPIEKLLIISVCL